MVPHAPSQRRFSHRALRPRNPSSLGIFHRWSLWPSLILCQFAHPPLEDTPDVTPTDTASRCSTFSFISTLHDVRRCHFNEWRVVSGAIVSTNIASEDNALSRRVSTFIIEESRNQTCVPLSPTRRASSISLGKRSPHTFIDPRTHDTSTDSRHFLFSNRTAMNGSRHSVAIRYSFRIVPRRVQFSILQVTFYLRSTMQTRDGGGGCADTSGRLHLLLYR
ncbi:hypothetical protein F5I97DRAFT_1258978 [Phlebopus sp. FC_14]|nr:hypothetical protein F5I97DRAFT_1258978 [Phlebopus sp. FC_14]